MQIEQHKTNKEKQILIGLITDKKVVSKIAEQWENNLFKTRKANLIASWCVKYYKKYEKPPLTYIETIFERWALKANDKAMVESIEKFLAALSDEYNEIAADSNSDYILDIAGQYFNQIKLEKLTDNIQDSLDADDVKNAEEQLNSFKRFDLGIGEEVNPIQDVNVIKEAFEQTSDVIIKHPGDLGKFFGNAMERDGFLAFMGPEKRGKSFWLLDTAYRAMLQRRKVAFFEAGDNSKHQVIRRLMSRVSQQPLKGKGIKVKKPKSMEITYTADGESIEVNYKAAKKFKKPLTWRQSWKKCKQLMRTRLKTRKSLFKLCCYPNSTLTVEMILNNLRSWERDGWTADVVVIDYADILNMDYPGVEGRDKIDKTWRQLRSLSQQFHCLVVTATQADAKSYGNNALNVSNFSEDKRKLAHVTGIMGLNQNEEEKEKGAMRLNWIVRREDAYVSNKFVHVAGNLAIANPAIISKF